MRMKIKEMKKKIKIMEIIIIKLKDLEERMEMFPVLVLLYNDKIIQFVLKFKTYLNNLHILKKQIY